MSSNSQTKLLHRTNSKIQSKRGNKHGNKPGRLDFRITHLKENNSFSPCELFRLPVQRRILKIQQKIPRTVTLTRCHWLRTAFFKRGHLKQYFCIKTASLNINIQETQPAKQSQWRNWSGMFPNINKHSHEFQAKTHTAFLPKVWSWFQFWLTLKSGRYFLFRQRNEKEFHTDGGCCGTKQHFSENLVFQCKAHIVRNSTAHTSTHDNA